MPELGTRDLSETRRRGSRFEQILSRSDAMWDIFEQVARVAPSEATVLIIGETGTGKELLARAIHQRSRRHGRFVACNCSSIPVHLVESELFGHTKGAFTGAAGKKGLVRHADGGTLFLDEIGEMPETAQLSLLRVLQERTIRPVGGHEEADVDLRIVAATNVPLEQAVAKAEFREDLFYRLDVIRFNVPPLRERIEDIFFLFGHFVKRLSKHYGLAQPTFADGFLDALSAHHWPGNVRQLENFAERVVLSTARSHLTAADFTRFMQAKPRTRSSAAPPRRGESQPALNLGLPLADNVRSLVERLEREYLEQCLRANRGRIQDTASHAGISRRTLLRKLKAYELDKSNFK